MVTARHWLAFPALGALTLFCRAAVFAAERELTRELALTLGAELTTTYDDNALLGRRGQFLDSASGAQKTDVAGLLSLDLNANARVAKRHRVTLASWFTGGWLRQTEKLAGFDFAAAVGFETTLAPGAEIVPELRFANHGESTDWTYRIFQPGLRARFTFRSGLMLLLRYQYSTQEFAKFESGAAAAKTSYGNIDLKSHVIELDLRIWQGRKVRWNLALDFQALEFAGNLALNLSDYAHLQPGKIRADQGIGATLALALVPSARWFISLGSRGEWNQSNSSAFTFRAAHALAEARWTFVDRHSFYAQADVGWYDFYLERFDTRFTNTRSDARAGLTAAYRFQVTTDLRVELVYRRQSASSNDCEAFDPERDDQGLPVYSRSYSCFARNRGEVSVRYEF